jgi:hypothetical protein
LGFLQLGGSLIETTTVPVEEEGVVDIIPELPPPQPAPTTKHKGIKALNINHRWRL